MTDPETLARKRFRPLANTLERRDRIDRDLRDAREQAGLLTAALPAAERNDRAARGRALADGTPPPKQGKKQRLAAELAATRQRADDLEAASELIAAELLQLRQTRQEDWAGSQTEAVARARAAVLEATGKLESAVAALEDELALRSWIEAPTGETAPDPHGGRLTHTGTLTTALDQVRAAVDGLAAGETTAEPPRREPVPLTKRLLTKAKPGWG